MLSSILSKVSSKNKEFVGVSLNPNGVLEIVQTNRVDKTVQKYTNRFVNYNPIKREIESYDAFRMELESGFESLDLNPKDCNVVLSMPSVLFGISSSLPSMITSPEDINGALVSEAEDAAYIFKSEEPVVSWVKLSDDGNFQKIGYTAIQDSVLREIKDVFESIGATLVSVQNAHATLVGGLSFSGRLANFIPQDTPYWNMLIVTGTSFSILNFRESVLENYYEEPLAVKSYSPTEVYSAVAQMASTALQNFAGSKVLIVSETDDISAEVMATKIVGETYYIEQNKFQQQPIIEHSLDILPNLVSQISISAIGASVDYADGNPLRFNFLRAAEGFKGVETPDIITLGSKSFELTTEKAKNLTILVCTVLLLIFGVFYGFGSFLSGNVVGEIGKYNKKEKELQEELKQYSKKPERKIELSSSMESVMESNRKKMLYYDALSYGIPDKLWLEFFEAGSAGEIAMSGIAMNSSDITSFLKGIREVSGESEVALTKLAIIDEENILNFDGQDLYSFQLATNSYGRAQVVEEVQVEEPQPKKSSRSSRKSKRSTPPANLPSLAPPVRIISN